MKLQLARHTHGDTEGLRVLHLDVVAERREEARCECLYLLRVGELLGAGQQGFEAVLILGHGAGAFAGHEFAQRVGTNQRPEAQVEKLRKMAPGQRAFLGLDLDVPELSAAFEIVRGHPDLLLGCDPLLMDVGFTPVEESQRIGLAIEFR